MLPGSAGKSQAQMGKSLVNISDAEKESWLGLERGVGRVKHTCLFSQPCLSSQNFLEGSGVPACHSWVETGKHEGLGEPQASALALHPPQYSAIAWGGYIACL